MATEAETFMLQQLEAAGIDYDVKRDFIHVSCPFHQHSGTKRKLGFSRTTGGMHCWVCEKKGHWNEYAELKRLECFSSQDPRLKDFEALRKQFDALVKNDAPAAPDWVERWRGRWRGLEGPFLRQVPSYLWFDEASDARRILWPIYMDAVFMGCTAARLHTSTFPKTRNFPGLAANKLLWPFDHELVRNSKTVVLVEGQFDALRLLHAGIPAVSILGTGNWSLHKLNRLAVRGVERLIVVMDGDVAGEFAQQEIIEAARSRFDVRAVPLPDPTAEERERGIDVIDPGNCSPAIVRLIARLARKQHGDEFKRA
jgi:hypothetical protein